MERRSLERIPGLCLLATVLVRAALGAEPPPCLTARAGETAQSVVMKTAPASEELLARLAYAEGLSTGFPNDGLVYKAIAWGVMNRVRLGEASLGMRRRYGSGIPGVIFQKGQFNPAVSPRSPFSKDFLCPTHPARWQLAVQAAGQALQGRRNPFIQTPWERSHNLSLVVNFYYPRSTQARGRLPPWEGSRTLAFIGDVPIGGGILAAERIRFYRLTQPPGDVRRPDR